MRDCVDVPREDRRKAFDEANMMIAFASRLIQDGLEERAILDLIVAMKRSDPNAIVLASDEELALSGIEIACMRIGRMFPVDGPVELDDENECDDDQ